MSQERTVAEIEAEIQASRQRLAGTLDELVARAQPQALAQRQVDGLKRSFNDATHDAKGDLRYEVIAGALGVVSAVFIGVGLLRRAFR